MGRINAIYLSKSFGNICNKHKIIYIIFILKDIMQAKRTKNQNQVHILTQKVDMKFIPEIYEKVSDYKTGSNNSGISSKIKNLFSFAKKSTPSTISENDVSSSSIVNSQASSSRLSEKSSKSLCFPAPLRFVQKISSEHILVGNDHQLDLIGVGNITENNFVDTDFYWSFKFKGRISFVAVDQKKMNVLAIIVNRTLKIYKYDCKKIPREQFKPSQQIVLEKQPILMTMAKDGNICLFYKKHYQIYGVGEQVRKRLARKYQVPYNQAEDNFQILTVPEPYENIINIFLAERLENDNIFALWGIELQFLALEIRSSGGHKIYDIKSQFKQSLSLTNYSRDIYIMNIKNEICAVKKGYILDSANLTINKSQEHLSYCGNQTLMHISKKMIQVYHFSLNTQTKPARIKIKSKDSIKIYDDISEKQFLRMLPILNNDFIFIYQIQQMKNKNRNGQVSYSMFITRGISKQQKINRLFPQDNLTIKLQSADLMERCDMARKMGLSDKQIYLELWSRTKRCTKQDYKILISTNDYQTIKDQVLKKLKKASMPFKEIESIEKQCFEILERKIFSPTCSQQAVLEYISCHFFLRKLEMFKDQELMARQKKQKKQLEEKQKKKQQQQKQQKKDEQESKNGKKKIQQDDNRIKMTIRQYQGLRSMEIKSQLINLVGLFCQEKKQSAINSIKFLLRNFKFVFRTMYHELLEGIIIKAENGLLDLLIAIPQLLPYRPNQLFQTQVGEPVGYNEGVWPEISKRQWKQSLYVDAITTIDNKQIILQKVIKDIPFRRNLYSQHDMVTMTKKQIEQCAQRIKSEETFYFFIAKMFENLKDVQAQKQVISFIEDNYDMMPKKIKKKIFLIQRMYRFLKEKDLLPIANGQECKLSDFLRFQDSEFIRHCFTEERSIKGLILKDIKPIYEEVCGQFGKAMFNQALLNYFISDLSEVSDLKYILNRINNEKRQFHRNNQQMYEILVEALERKLKIGTDNDIPIEEVLVYLENIPLKSNINNKKSEPNKALVELRLIEKINLQVKTLQTAKLNMSIYDILHNQDEVIKKLVDHTIYSNNIICPQNYELTAATRQRVQKFTYETIALFQNLSEQIYEKSMSTNIFFIYITKLCESAEMIKHANYLLKNQPLKICYNESTAESVVCYMYKWKMNQQIIMVENEYYVSQLLQLIDKHSTIYIYIESQMKYAKIFSRPQNPYEFPITQDIYTIKDLKDELRSKPVEFLMTLDLQNLHSVIKKMQQIALKTLQQDDSSAFQQEITFSVSNFVSLHQIYEIVIVEMILAKKLKQVLPYIRKLMELQISDTTYNIIYPILYIIQISGQINDDNKNTLVGCISYYFYHPWSLLEILQGLTTSPLNTREIRQYLQRSLQKGKKMHKCYNDKNKVFNPEYIEALTTKQSQTHFTKVLEKTTKHMQELKQQFKDVKYAAIMAMLCNQPYALAKFISCSGRINVSAIRCFLSYAIKESIFSPLGILELGRRIFLILLEAQKANEALQQVIQRYEDVDLLDQQIQAQYVFDGSQKILALQTWWKSAEAFSKKRTIISKQMQKTLKVNLHESKQEKSQRIKKSLEAASQVDKKQLIQYPFSHFDDDNEAEDIVDIRESVGFKKQRNLLKFDAEFERNKALNKGNKGNLFHSTRQQIPRGGSGQLSMSIKGPNYKTENRSFFNSIHQMKKKNSASFEDKDGVDLTESHNIYQSQRPTKSHRAASPVGSQYQQRKSVLKSVLSQDHLDVQSEQILSQHEVSNPYVVQINQVEECQNQNQQQAQQNMVKNQEVVKEPEFTIAPEIIARKLIQDNKLALQTSKNIYNFTCLEKYSDEPQMLKQIIKEIYIHKPENIKIMPVIKMFIEINKQFPRSEIEQESLSMLIKVIQNQEKFISEVAFENIFPADHILDKFQQKKDIFNLIESKLCESIEDNNFSRVGLFVRKAFNGYPNLQGQITWDFVLNICNKIDSCEEEQANLNLEKIQSTLHKIKLSIWIDKFDNFTLKVLTSNNKDKLLTIFCEYLKNAIPQSDAKQFLKKLSRIDNSQIVKETLKQIDL